MMQFDFLKQIYDVLYDNELDADRSEEYNIKLKKQLQEIISHNQAVTTLYLGEEYAHLSVINRYKLSESFTNSLYEGTIFSAYKIAEIINKITTVEEFIQILKYLSKYTKYRSGGLSLLFESLSYDQTIQHLVISHRLFNIEIAKSLYRGLKRNNHLKVLRLFNCSFDLPAFQYLLRLIPQLTALEKLDMRYVALRKEQRAQIKQLVLSDSALSKFIYSMSTTTRFVWRKIMLLGIKINGRLCVKLSCHKRFIMDLNDYINRKNINLDRIWRDFDLSNLDFDRYVRDFYGDIDETEARSFKICQINSYKSVIKLSSRFMKLIPIFNLKAIRDRDLSDEYDNRRRYGYKTIRQLNRIAETRGKQYDNWMLRKTGIENHILENYFPSHASPLSPILPHPVFEKLRVDGEKIRRNAQLKQEIFEEADQTIPKYTDEQWNQFWAKRPNDQQHLQIEEENRKREEVARKRVETTGVKEIYLERIQKTNRHQYESLQLNDRQFSPQDWKELFLALRLNTSLTSLNISHTLMNGPILQEFSEAIEPIQTLHTLNLSHNFLGRDHWHALQKMIQNHHLSELNLLDNKLGARKTSIILELVKTLLTSSLRILNLQYNSIDDSGVEFVSFLLENNATPLRVLNLRANLITAEGSQFLVNVLTTNQTLIHLNLWGNNLQDIGALHIARLIQQNHTLLSINLWDNDISDEGGRALLEALQSNKTLLELNVYGNRISLEIIEEINFSLLKNRVRVEKLFDAIRSSNILKVKRLFAKGLSPYVFDEKENASLHIAVLSGQLDVVNFLLEQPFIDVHTKNFDGQTASDLAIQQGRVEIAERIREAEAKQRTRRHQDVELSAIYKFLEEGLEEEPGITTPLIEPTIEFESQDFAGDEEIPLEIQQRFHEEQTKLHQTQQLVKAHSRCLENTVKKLNDEVRDRQILQEQKVVCDTEAQTLENVTATLTKNRGILSNIVQKLNLIQKEYEQVSALNRLERFQNDRDVNRLEKQIIQLEASQERYTKKIHQLETNQLTLMAEYEQHQEKLSEQRLILNNPLLKLVYRRIQLKLTELFLAIKVTQSGLVEREIPTVIESVTQRSSFVGTVIKKLRKIRDEHVLLTKIFTVIQLAEETLPIPHIEKIISTLSAGEKILQRRHASKTDNRLGKLFYSITDMEAGIECIARTVTLIYQEQIQALTRKGAKTFAECIVRRLLEAIRNGQITNDEPLLLQTRRTLMTFNSNQGSFPFTQKRIETRERENKWTDRGILQETGIVVIANSSDSQYYYAVFRKAKLCSNPDQYGYRQGSFEDIHQVEEAMLLKYKKAVERGQLETEQLTLIRKSNPTITAEPLPSQSLNGENSQSSLSQNQGSFLGSTLSGERQLRFFIEELEELKRQLNHERILRKQEKQKRQKLASEMSKVKEIIRRSKLGERTNFTSQITFFQSSQESELQNQFGLQPIRDFEYTPGNCLFDAVAVCMTILREEATGPELRDLVLSSIENSQELREFITPIIEESTFNTVQEYITAMGNITEWGSGIELDILSRVLEKPIAIINPNRNYVSVRENEAYAENTPIFLYYNGTHYEPLRVSAGQSAQDILTRLREAQERTAQERERAGDHEPQETEALEEGAELLEVARNIMEDRAAEVRRRLDH